MDKRLSEIYIEWQNKLDNDEWYFANAFETITKEMSSEEAYNFIPVVIEQLFQLDNDLLIWETLYLLCELYIISDTTQIHSSLREQWTSLEKHIQNYECYTPFQELKRHLRIL